jgi:hypothetical protein
MSDTPGEHQRRLETWAADRVKAWSRKLRINDYDFRSWAERASKNCLHAGAVYEYARESRRLRCLLALMNPKRPRETWEVMRPGSIDGGPPEPDEVERYHEADWLPCSFESMDEHDGERALGGFLYCLCDLADYLADNISFGELFRSKRHELENAFGGLDKLTRRQREFRNFLPIIDPVDVATRSEAHHPTVWESLSDDKKRVISGGAFSEVVAIQIHWRFSDQEISAGMKKLVRALRPDRKKYEPRQRKKGSRLDSVRFALDCLSAMRLASYLPKAVPLSIPGLLAAWKSGASAELKQCAMEVFNMVRLGGHAKDIAESNFDNLITEGRTVFKKSFPFGENAANAPTLAERIMMKSKRISSQDKL